jgi:type I restriction enzyme, R subunit
MVISIDKATTVRIYDKVQKHWKAALTKLEKAAAQESPGDKEELDKRLKFLSPDCRFGD